MPFNSLPYLGFLTGAASVYWLLPPRFRRVFVLLASLAFYMSWGAVFVWLPLVVAGAVYLFGGQIHRDAAGARKWMWTGIVFVLGLLVFFKYRSFILLNFSLLAREIGAHPVSLAMSVAFPVGISFYTFEAIAYFVDVRQGRVAAPKLMDLCLFFMFWPNILSGPIVRARELAPQLNFRKAFEPRFVFEGMDRVIWGLVQKNVIANMLGMWVDRGFSPGTPGAPSTIDSWFLAIAFALQIYFDFAGYTSMAIGAARLLGVTLPENFRQPYHAATPPEFWSRWHMTLSRWIRDYLFFPLNAKWHGSPVPLYFSLIGAMALVGLWHGAGWNYLAWGFLHGVYLVAYRIYEAWKAEHSVPGTSRLVATMGRVLTLIGVLGAWVVFRASSLSKAGVVLASMFYRFGGGRAFGGGFYVFTLGVVLFCALEPFILRRLTEMEAAGANGLSPIRIVGRPIAYLSGLLLFLLFDENNMQFIYSQF